MTESAQELIKSPAAEVFGEAKKNWGWMLALGILFIILGTIGLGMSVSLTLVSVLFFGWLLIIGGVFQLVEAFKVKGWKSVLWHIIMAVIYVIAGAVILYDPIGGALALTMILSAALIAIGILRIMMGFQLKGASGWWWPLVAGLLSIVLGVMIMAKWPSSAFWVIGMFIAIDMIFNGWSYVMMALTAKQAAREEELASPSAAAPA